MIIDNMGFDRLEAFIKDVTNLDTGVMGVELRKSFYVAAAKTADFARKRYAFYNGTPSFEHARSAEQGKKAGKHPARAPRSLSNPRLRLLQQAVRSRMVNRFNHRVEIDPNARHPDARLRFPGGTPLPLMAEWIENPKPSVVPITPRMVAYFRMLDKAEKVTRGDKGSGSGGKRFIIMQNPPRPVWRDTAQYAVTKQIPTIIRAITRALIVIARKHGGRAL